MKYIKPILEERTDDTNWSAWPTLLDYLSGNLYPEKIPAEEWKSVQALATQWAELVVDTIGTNLGMLEAHPTHQVKLLNIEIVEGNFDNNYYDADEMSDNYEFAIDIYAAPEFTPAQQILDSLYPDERMVQVSLLFDANLSTGSESVEDWDGSSSRVSYVDAEDSSFKLTMVFVGEGDIEVQISDRARKMIQHGMQDLFGTSNRTAVRKMTARTGPR